MNKTATVAPRKKQNLHFRRFEFKYHLPVSIAKVIQANLLNYMTLDDFASERGYYDVHSIYFDSPDFKAYREKIAGLHHRRKLRLRTYTNTWETDQKPFLEIKRKQGPIILKDRIEVTKESLKGLEDRPLSLLNTTDYDREFLNEFLFDYTANRMRPVVLVSYRRTPLVSNINEHFRVTFDHNIEFSRADGLEFPETKAHPSLKNVVILEVKFNGRLPSWFRQIIEGFRLERNKFSKYCAGVSACYSLPH